MNKSVVLAAAAVSLGVAQATPLYWDGNSTTAGAGNTTAFLSKTWGTDSMWSDDAAGTGSNFTSTTSASDDLYFVAGPSGSSGNVAFTVTVSGTQAAGSLNFQKQGTMTLSGGTQIDLGAGINVSQYAYGTTNNGGVAISTPIALQASQSFTNNSTGGLVISGGISEAGEARSLTKSGTGSLTLSGTNTYSGGTVLSAGTLNINAAKALGTGSLTINGGTINNNSGATVSLLSNTTTTGNVVKNSTTIDSLGSTAGLAVGQFVYGSNVPGGAYITSIGANQITISAAPGASTTGATLTFGSLATQSWDGDFAFTGTNNLNMGSGAVTLSAARTVTVNGGVLTVGGVIGDSGSGYGLTKVGAGTLSLTGASTYTGTTTVKAGAVAVGVAAASGAPGAFGNSTSAVLLGDTSGTAAATIQSSLTSGTAISRSITVQSGNTGVASILGTNGSGTVQVAGDIQLGSTDGPGHGVTFGTNQYGTINYSGAISDPSGLVSGTAAPVTLQGAGTIVLSGVNTFAGGIAMNSTLWVNNASALGTGTLTINGGTLSLASAVAPATVFNNPQIWNGNFSFTNNLLTGNGQGMTFGGNVSLTGNRTISVNILGMTENGIISDGGSGYGLTYSGGAYGNSLSLNGANTFSGGVLISSNSAATATLNAGNASALGSGLVRLTSRANSRLNLTAGLTVDSLSSAIVAPTFAAGTGGPNGTQNLVITGGGGSGATGTVTIAGGAITAVTITDYGRDYTSVPTFALSTPGGTGTITGSFATSSVNLGANTLTIAGTNSIAAAYGGVILGTGRLTKTGAGVQALAASSLYSGDTTVSGGSLLINTPVALASSQSGSTTKDSGTISVADTTGLVVGQTISATSGIPAGAYITAINSPTSITISAAASSTGARTVSFGAASGTGTGNVIVAGGTLGGSGIISPSGGNRVSIGNAGILSPGNSPGTLTLNLTASSKLEFTDGSTLTFELGTDSDLVQFATVGDWLSSSGTTNLNLVLGEGFDYANSYTVFKNVSTSGFAFSSITGYDTATYEAALGQSGNDYVVSFSQVPEPSTLMGAGALGMMLFGARRRRRN